MVSFVSHLLFLLLISLVVLVTSSSVEAQGRGRVERDEVRRSSSVRHRPRMRQTSPKEAIRRQIERVKEKILSQLSYSVRTAPAPGNARTSLPQPLLHMYDIDVTRQSTASALVHSDGRWSSHGIQATHDLQQEFKYKQATLIVFGHRRRRKRGWSYRFHVQGAASGVEVTSASLWLHKTRDVISVSGSRLTLSVQSVYDDDVDDDATSRPQSRRYQLSWTSGWVQLDITELVRRPGARLTVRCVGSSAVQCRPLMSASSRRRRPFVVVGTAAPREPERRSRRHLRRCVDGACCMLYEYYVNTTDLGWAFIVKPSGFPVNYCYGSCITRTPWAQDNHANRSFYRSVLNRASEVYDNRRLGGCCAPSATRPLSVLYVNQQDQVIAENVPGVIVEACECV